ncbi:hypothetical protein BGLA2_190026 [Burkholderia gladioli]|nr:hypothetical protein BGLA2_190026 [Burkholderia gladioli]
MFDRRGGYTRARGQLRALRLRLAALRYTLAEG